VPIASSAPVANPADTPLTAAMHWITIAPVMLIAAIVLLFIIIYTFMLIIISYSPLPYCL